MLVGSGLVVPCFVEQYTRYLMSHAFEVFLRDYASFCVFKKCDNSDAMQLLVVKLYCINLCYV